MANVAQLRKPRQTVGGLIDEMKIVRDLRRDIAKQDKELSAQSDALEAQLIELMDKEGVSKSTGRQASAGISESVNFNVVDWDAFCAFMVKNKAFHLVQRRVSAPAAREIAESKGKAPAGLEAYVKRVVNLRDL